MSKSIVITSSASCLDYYEYPHNIHIIPGLVTLNGVLMTDVEEICPMRLKTATEESPTLKIEYLPPRISTIKEELLQLLTQGYTKILIITTNQSDFYQNFVSAILNLPKKYQKYIRIYTSITLSFGTGLLALKADALLQQNKTFLQIFLELNQLEENNILFYTIPVLENNKSKRHLPFFKKRKKESSLKNKLMLMKSEGTDPAQSIAVYTSHEALLERVEYEVKKYLCDRPYNGYVVCPVNQPSGRWFAEKMEERLNSEHLCVFPVTPIIASRYSIDYLAIRVYNSNEDLSELYYQNHAQAS